VEELRVMKKMNFKEGSSAYDKDDFERWRIVTMMSCFADSSRLRIWTFPLLEFRNPDELFEKWTECIGYP
jgi:hypothetical protein